MKMYADFLISFSFLKKKTSGRIYCFVDLFLKLWLKHHIFMIFENGLPKQTQNDVGFRAEKLFQFNASVT